MGFHFKHAVWVLLSVTLTACSSLPRGAAIEKEILATADDVDSEIAVYPVTRAFLPSVQSWPDTGARSYAWIGHSHGTA
ncbi:MAG: hypothetical protein WBB25_20020, partial [Sulfitobacter sp.]